jgi:hypothetical protein
MGSEQQLGEGMPGVLVCVFETLCQEKTAEKVLELETDDTGSYKRDCEWPQCCFEFLYSSKRVQQLTLYYLFCLKRMFFFPAVG